MNECDIVVVSVGAASDELKVRFGDEWDCLWEKHRTKWLKQKKSITKKKWDGIVSEFQHIPSHYGDAWLFCIN